MALEALGTRRAFGEADVYINDEKNSRVKGNLTTTIPVTPCFPQKWGEQASRRRLFSDLVIIRGTRLDPQSFPTVDKVPRRNKNYMENEQAMYMTYNRELKKFLGELIAKNATCIHVDFHFTKGDPNALEHTAKQKLKQYKAAFQYFAEKGNSEDATRHSGYYIFDAEAHDINPERNADRCFRGFFFLFESSAPFFFYREIFFA